MDNLKAWLIRLGLDQAGPSAIRGSILGLVGWLAVKNNIIPGVTTDAAKHITTIAWDQVQSWAITGLPAVGAFLIKLFQVHGTNVIQSVKGDQPQ